MSLMALAALVTSGVMVAPAKVTVAQDAAPVLIRDVRIVVKPGTVIERGNILIRDGKFEAVGSASADGAEVIDGAGLTAYAGFIHPQLNGPLPSAGDEGGSGGGGGRGQGGGGQQSAANQAAAQRQRDEDPFGVQSNFRLKESVRLVKEGEVGALPDYAKSGYSLANLVPSGGVIGPEPGVLPTNSERFMEGTAMDGRTVSVRVSTRGFGGYPGSTMGVMAFIRQMFYDAKDATAEQADLSLLKRATDGSARPIFEGLNDVSFFMAQKVAKEFGLKPVYSFNSGAGAVKDLLGGSGVLLRGTVPSRPSIGDDLSRTSLDSVRGYFNEVQAGAELEKAGVAFAYAPASSGSPLEGLRTYVRAGLSKEAALASLTTVPASILGMEGLTGTVEAGKRADLVLVQGDVFDSSSQVMATFSGGKRAGFAMPERKSADALKADEALKTMPANYALFPAPAEKTKAFRLYKNATVWTQGPQGTLAGADVLIRDGKIVAVGRGLAAPEGCEVVDATGKHISPGIWDAHSHTGISGGVNEGSQMITVQVRIRDVVDHTQTNIYQQLSGGTVGALQLHGSANAIGGQSNTVKWRWGMRPDDLTVEGAPEGVKFALGQNPIREDGGGNTAVGTTLLTFRPRTRMGVEEAIRRALALGQEYNQAWDDYRAGRRTTKPRTDLQLEGLGEIVKGTRWIHSHGYRADEMLMLIRVTKEFGARLQTLQHVLEGYKIADEMAAAGVGASTFSDWWGFKLEAYDAIPFNAALMAERGVSVSVNSDSGNHARRLNQEAAKSMRYGGVTAEQALSFVTIGPARQLGIDDKTGSIEVGKDADLAVWTAEPLSIYAICTETYVDGVKRFDRANDAAQRAAREEELKKAKALLTTVSGDSPFSTGASASDGGKGDEVAAVTKTTATFGIATLEGQPATMRYARKPVVITGGTVHPMSGDPYVGDVLIGSDGKIVAVGRNLKSDGAVVVNARGKHVYPGLIDPAAGLGLNEIGQVPASDDSSERGDYHPDYRVERTINPEWETLSVARHQGILTALVKPSGSGIPGQAALIHTEGYTYEDLTIQGGVALATTVGGGGRGFGDALRFDDSLSHDHDGHDHDAEAHLHQHGLDLVLDTCCGHYHNDEVYTSGMLQQGGGSGSLSGLTARLDEARTYARDRRLATPEKPLARDQRHEAMLLVAEGRLPVMISVNSAADIKTCVEWAEKEKVKILLYGCQGAGEIADWLAAKGVPIVLTAVYSLPGADLPVDYFYSLPAKLSKAGVKFCLSINDDKDARQLRDVAGWAAAYGVDREEAARLMTLRTAEILGIDNRLGSIRPGLDGTVILTDGEITETRTQVLRAWIQGREVPLESKQTRLYDKYRTRPRG